MVAGGILEPTVGRGWVNQWNLANLKATKVASLPAEVRERAMCNELERPSCVFCLIPGYIQTL